MASKLVFVLVGEENSPARIRYAFDPEKQYALVLVESRFDANGSPQEVTKVLDFKDCQDGRYFPMRSITASHRGDKGILIEAQEIAVETVDLVSKPADSVFQLTVPKGTRVTDGISGITIKLTKDEKVDFSNMTTLLERVQKEVVRNEEVVARLARTPIEPTISKNEIRWLSVLGVVASIGLLFLSARLFRRQAVGR